MKDIRRVAARILALVLLLGLLAPWALAVAFSDTQGHWAENAINYWTDQGMLYGDPEGTFRPDDYITRGEAAAVIARVMGYERNRLCPYFADVPENHFANKSIDACVRAGAFSGYGDGTFLPDANISREEAMAVICRITTYTAPDPLRALTDRPDGDKVSTWAKKSVGTLVACGIVKGDPNGSLRPGDPISRAEFVSILYRVERDDGFKAPTDDPLGFYCRTDADTPAILAGDSGSDLLLVLPAWADLQALTVGSGALPDGKLTVSGDLSTVSGTGEAALDLTAIAAPDSEGIYHLTLTVVTADRTAVRELQVIRSGQLNAMFLTSDDPDAYGRAYVEIVKGNSTTGSMLLRTPEGTTVYSGALSQIKSRGNSTFSMPKKSYQIKLENKTDLLGLGEKGKTWVLLANYVDATMFHDKLCKDLAKDMGLEGTADCDWVDLYYDGEYRGTYLLSEKVQVNTTVLDIRDLEADYEDLNPDYGTDPEIAGGFNRYGNYYEYVTGLTDPEDITDGYVLELNNTWGWDEHCGFGTSQGVTFNVKAPEDLSENAVTYISEFYQEFEDAVYAVDGSGAHTGINPDTGKSFDEYCDLTALAKMFLLYAFSDNYDAYLQSTYFYKQGDKLYAGPVWDSDQSFGLGWSARRSPEAPMRRDYLVSALVEIPAFREAARALYFGSFRSLAMRYAQETAYGYSLRLRDSERANHLLWPTYYATGDRFETWPDSTTYEELVEMDLEWMLRRIDYLDDWFGAW